MSTGVLPLYAALLEKDPPCEKWKDQQVLVLKGLWTLAFNDNCKKKILETASITSSWCICFVSI